MNYRDMSVQQLGSTSPRRTVDIPRTTLTSSQKIVTRTASQPDSSFNVVMRDKTVCRP